MEELDLKELLQIFWEKKTQIILIIAIFAVIGVIYSLAFVTPKYQSSTTLLLDGLIVFSIFIPFCNSNCNKTLFFAKFGIS